MTDNEIAIQALMAAKNSAEWAFWAMIGSFLSGFATVAAVVTSLYLAKTRPKPRIRGEIIISAMKKMSWQNGIGISVANIGQLPINITGLVWHFAGKSTFMHDFAPGSHKLPKKLEHGESAFFFIENDEHILWAHDVKNFILENHGKIDKLRMVVNLGTMDKQFIKPAPEVLDIIKRA
jgi:hypothetical protein